LLQYPFPILAYIFYLLSRFQPHAPQDVRQTMAVNSVRGAKKDSAFDVVPSSPHMVFFLVDDLGWNDMGYQSADIPNSSPNLDALAAGGVKLGKYYTQYDCTPARASLMTGKYPMKLGMQHECITPTSPWGLPKTEATMASMLRESGSYSTHIVGKWDLGHYAQELWPTFRGFDTFFGLSCYGFDNYFSHDNKGFWDLHDFTAIEGRFEPDVKDYGVYSTYLFGSRAVDIVTAHPPAKPLFLYVPFNAVHNTLSVPPGFNQTETWAELTRMVTYPNRQLFAGALYLMDVEVGRIVAELKAKGMYQNTIIVVASDNGGSPVDGGNNWPLRGAKKTLFEGGVHVPAFVHSPLLAADVVGTTYAGLVHVSDWAPTLLLGAAGLALEGTRAEDFDGFDLWSELNTAGGVGPRKEVLLNIDYVSQVNGGTPVGGIGEAWMGLLLEVRGKHFKLMTHQFDYSYYSPGSNAGWGMPVQSNYSTYLFDLSTDPKEKTNLFEHIEASKAAYDMEELIAVFSARLCHFYSDVMVPTQYKPQDASAKTAMNKFNNDWVTYWKPYEDGVAPVLELRGAPQCEAAKLARKLWAFAEGNGEDDAQVDDDVTVMATMQSTVGHDVSGGPRQGATVRPAATSAEDLVTATPATAAFPADALAAAAAAETETAKAKVAAPSSGGGDELGSLLARKQARLSKVMAAHDGAAAAAASSASGAGGGVVMKRAVREEAAERAVASAALHKAAAGGSA